MAIQGHWFASFAAHPAFWLAPALAVAAAQDLAGEAASRSANGRAFQESELPRLDADEILFPEADCKRL